LLLLLACFSCKLISSLLPPFPILTLSLSLSL